MRTFWEQRQVWQNEKSEFDAGMPGGMAKVTSNADKPGATSGMVRIDKECRNAEAEEGESTTILFAFDVIVGSTSYI